MAAPVGKSARVTLTATRLLFLDKNQRFFSTCKICLGNTWYVRDKPSRLREIYKKAPIDAEKFTGKGDVEHIIIPNKIERSPTAILEALASTVNNNINQPMYKSIDDPYLYLTSDRLKRQNLAAMDGGHKTAQTMMSMYPDYFTQIWEEPLPDSYRDANLGYKFKDPSEEALLERIAKLSVNDAVGIYKDLMASKRFPSQEAQEKLLELLTVFNCKNPETSSDLSNYVNPPILDYNAPFPATTWKKGNMAEQIFNSLPEKTAKAYCLMIRGMAACYDKQRALDMFNEMKAAKLTVDTYTYNLLLSVASLDTQSMEDVKQYVEEILRDMAENNVKPNAGTFNSVLHNCRRLSRWSGSRNFALSTMSEMKACGIEPTLETYYELLSIFYYQKDKARKTPKLFEKILDEIEGKEFKFTSANDALFFRTAMKVIVTHIPDSKYALRLHKILQTGKNNDLLCHRMLQYAYYNDLFLMITPLEHIDVVMELYSSVVPFIFAPSSDVYSAILDSIAVHDAYGYLPGMYTDIHRLTIFHEQFFTEKFAQLMAKQKHDPQLQGQLCDIATSILKKWLEERHSLLRFKPHMDGSVIGHLMITFLNNDELNKAWELFQLYKEDSQLQAADPSESSLTRLTEHLIEKKDYTSTKEVLNQMHSLGCTSLTSLVEKVLQAFELSDQEKNYLKVLAADSLSSSERD